MQFLVVGSSLEAAVALEILSGIQGVEKLWHLPTNSQSYGVVAADLNIPRDWSDLSTSTVQRCAFRNRWGHELFSFKLKTLRVVKTPLRSPCRSPLVESLAQGLELVRVRATSTEEGRVRQCCDLSDGTELLADGVIFADGPRSRGRVLMERPTRGPTDSDATICWRFTRPDLLNCQAWEFRTAPGKSVEQLPLPDGQVRVKLRFRTAVGGNLGPSELKSLFSEFGSDMEALLENVTPGQIEVRTEESPNRVAFVPLPGCFALGEAALGVPLLGTFAWGARLVRAQVERMTESLLVGHWDPSAWEPACQEALTPILQAERFIRRGLHYDNPILRPLRDVVVRWTPSSVLAGKVRRRLIL